MKGITQISAVCKTPNNEKVMSTKQKGYITQCISDYDCEFSAWWDMKWPPTQATFS